MFLGVTFGAGYVEVFELKREREREGEDERKKVRRRMKNCKTCSTDAEAVVHKISRTLSVKRAVAKVNELSKEDDKEKQQWEKTGREMLTDRSKRYSSHFNTLKTRSGETDSEGDSGHHGMVSSDSMPDGDPLDPLSSCNAQYAISLLQDGLRVDSVVIDNIKARMALTTPIVHELERVKGKGISKDEIAEIRKGLLREAGCFALLKQLDEKGTMNDEMLKEVKMSESGVHFFRTIYYGAVPDILTTDDEQYSDLRKVIRATLSKLFVNNMAKEHFSVRDWYTSRGIQPRPTYTCSLISSSDLLLGQGPNGGHGGTGIYKDAVERERAKADMQQHLTRMTSHVKELWMSGHDINQRIFHRVNRDEEVIGFLVGLKEMKVGTVIALGFPRSYNMTNVKTLICGKTGYADADLFSRPAFQALERRDEVYKKNTARDFFNYFGAKDGDDGLPWRDIGEGVRACQIQEFSLKSTLVKSLKNDIGAPMDVYDLEVSWTDGCLCTRVDEVLKLRVINIRTWDQGPSLLLKDQVSELVETVLHIHPDSSFVFIHCAGGIGRTGNLAYGLSEILCPDVPKDPLKKLEWLRSQRQGCIQSPEQLVDGMILSHMIMEEVVERSLKSS